MAMKKGPPFERFKPFTRRQRLLIMAMAVGTTLTIGVSMLTPHVAYLRAKLSMKPPEVPACTAGQTTGCVGGTMGVIMISPAGPPAASAPR
jgi:hypothetical protein